MNLGVTHLLVFVTLVCARVHPSNKWGKIISLSFVSGNC